MRWPIDTGDRPILLIHAHPDDEVFAGGAAVAKLRKGRALTAEMLEFNGALDWINRVKHSEYQIGTGFQILDVGSIRARNRMCTLSR